MASRYRRFTPRSTPSTPNPKIELMRRIRVGLRQGGSAALDATRVLCGADYALAARMVDGSQRLLDRLGTLERRAA